MAIQVSDYIPLNRGGTPGDGASGAYYVAPVQQLVDLVAGSMLSSIALDDLGDIDAGAPNNGDVLTWDAATGRWVPASDNSVMQAVLQADKVTLRLTDADGNNVDANLSALNPAFSAPGMAATNVHDAIVEANGVPGVAFAEGNTPAERAASVRQLLDAGEKHIVLPAGTYDPVDVDKPGVKLRMWPGVVFRLPSGSSTPSDTVAKSALVASAPGVCFDGSFVVDGNKSGNDGSGLPTSQRAGILAVEADDVCFTGVVHIKDAYFRGLSVGASSAVRNFYAAGFVIDDPDHYAALLWEVDGFNIGSIVARASTQGALADPRIRLGTESSSAAKCRNGYIGLLRTEGEASVVLEAHTEYVRVDCVDTANGGKLEEASGVSIGSWVAPKCNSDQHDRVGFGMSGCDGCHVDLVEVRDFNCLSGASTPAVWFWDTSRCSVNRIVVRGSHSNALCDMIIRKASGLVINSVDAQDPNGCAVGVFYDAGYPPEEHNYIGHIVSRGHTNDVVLERRFPELVVNYINEDAISQYPNTTRHVSGGMFAEGVWVPEYSSTGGDMASVTYDPLTRGRWTRVGNIVTVEGSIRTDALDASGASGVVTIKSLPFPVSADGGDATGTVGYASGFGVPVNTVYATGGTDFLGLIHGHNSFVAPSDLGTGSNANTLKFSITYRIGG